MIRVVLDTNVLVSSFLAHGNPRSVIEQWWSGRILLCLSRPIIDEYVEVLVRLGIPKEELSELLGLFASGFNCLFTHATPTLSVCKDPDDDKFIACAVALDAKIIISGDKHLLEIGKYTDTEILSPAEFLGRGV